LLATVAALLAAPAAPAQAKIPDQWGFAFNNLPNPPAGYVMPRQWGSWKSLFPADWATVTQVGPGPGLYQVRFPKIAGKGVVHVTAVNSGPVWCQIAKWGPVGVDEIVYVRCHSVGGAPKDSAFTVMYSESSGIGGPPYGWVWGTAAGTLANGYNASGALNTVAPLPAPGRYVVELPGLGSGFDGNIQVTAVNSQVGARCKVARWSPIPTGQRVYVFCHNGANMPFSTDFTLTYHHKVAVYGAVSPPDRFAYIWDTLGGWTPPGANVNSLGGINTVVPAGPGLRLIRFPLVGLDPSHVQVTANGINPEFCNLLTAWGIFGGNAVVRDVACYDGTGTLVNQPSFVTYTSRF
jgi:hypothetical protein